jgi:hypothetical protein
VVFNRKCESTINSPKSEVVGFPAHGTIIHENLASSQSFDFEVLHICSRVSSALPFKKRILF